MKDQLARYGYVDMNLRPSPYVVSQMNGAYYWLPDFIGSDHPLQSTRDVASGPVPLDVLKAAVARGSDGR